LGSSDFDERDRAHRELLALGEAARSGLDRATADADPEKRRRLEDLRSQLEQGSLPTEELRHVRAVEVLERAGGAEAVRLPSELAQGDPAASRTREARAALEHLKRKTPAP